MTTSTSGASRSLASATEATNAVSTTGASKAPISNIGVEVERDQNNILRNGY
jgi:type 1 fimbria pilin